MGQAPSVGNVLGVALLYRDRKALLCVEQRTLREGVRIRGYQAEVHGVQLPARTPASPSDLRHRRTDALEVELEFDAAPIERWVSSRLVGETLAGLRIDRATLDFDARLGPTARGTALTLEGQDPFGGWVWRRIAVRIAPRGRTVSISRGPTWQMGARIVDCDQLCGEILRRLVGDDTALLDPTYDTVSRALVRNGWKAPRLDRLAIQRTVVDAHQIQIALSANQAAPHASPVEHDETRALAREMDDISTMTDTLGASRAVAALAQRIGFCAEANAAAWQWSARVAYRDALRDEVAREPVEFALERWIEACPGNALAHRMRFELRARRGDVLAIDAALAERSTPRSTLARAAIVLHNGDVDAAREHLDAAARAFAVSPDLPGLHRDLAWLRALCHADEPALARTFLRDALRGDGSDAQRSADVAQALLREGHPRVALDIAAEALIQTPTDQRLLGIVGRAAESAHDAAAAFEHAQALVSAAPELANAPEFRLLLARLAVRVRHPDALTYVADALVDAPEDPELLREAAVAHRAHGNTDAALAAYRTLRDVLPPSSERARVMLDEALFLDELGRDGDVVWEVLWPALGKLPRDDQRRGFALAVEVAPSSDVESWVRRLRARVELESALRALHRRWIRRKIPDPATVALHDALIHAGATDEALALAHEAANASTGRERAGWLARAAVQADGPTAAALLDEALQAAPDDLALAQRLVTLLDRTGQDADLTELWRRRANDPTLPRAARVEALDNLLSRTLSGGDDPRHLASVDPAVADLFDLRLEFSPDDITANLVAADRAHTLGDAELASQHWERALASMPTDDPRAGAAARSLAAGTLAQGRADEAVALLLRATEADPENPAGWAKLADAAEAAGDVPLRLHALESQLAHTVSAAARGDLMLELSRLHQRQGDVAQSTRWLEQAGGHPADDSTGQSELAEAWMAIARDPKATLEQQLLARERVRALLGEQQPPDEERAEALLLLDAGRVEEALERIESALSRAPTDEVLLSTLQELVGTDDEDARFATALERAVQQMQPGERRDTLLAERATLALRAGNANAALEALDMLGQATADRSDLLDLRDWAVHELGREDEELRWVGDGLRASPSDGRLLERLRRLLAGDDAAMSEHMLGLALGAERDASTALTLRALALALQTDDGAVLRRAVRRAYDIAPTDLRVRDAWQTAVERAFVDDDPDGLSDLLDMRVDPTRETPAQDQALVDEEIERGLRTYPRAERLHRVLVRRHRSETAAREALESVASSLATQGINPIDLYIGFASQLDRAEASAVLQARARRPDATVGTLSAIADALAERGHIAEQLSVLEIAAERAEDDQQRVRAFKDLAHVAADRVGDQVRAMAYLERATEFAPNDPDLLLPLLEHVFERRALAPILDYTHRVLDHVEMGNAGFVTLVHRAADAALARGDHGAATRLLERAHERDPNHATTNTRLLELRTMAEDPAHRAALLEQVAQRQRGEARLDALEERARLLAGPLGRPREAAREYAAVLREDPQRPDARATLAEILEAQGEWRDLVELHERHVAQVYGVERCVLLRTIAAISREHLHDLQRSEQALRVGLEHLGEQDDPEAFELAEDMRAELVRDLEAQGRYVDLAIYLERTLALELDGLPPSALLPSRTTLLVELARIYRGPLDDEVKAARVYEQLERYGHLPDEGLATLARAYQREGRHDDLVRILKVRYDTLQGDPVRRAAVSVRIAQLLEAALGRPHEAARYYLDAYSAAPSAHRDAGTKARVLLSGTDAVARVRADLHARLDRVEHAHRPAMLTLLGDLLAVHDEYEDEAEAHYRQALEQEPNLPATAEALGRLMARQGRLEEAAPALVTASTHPDVDAAHAAEIASVAARVLTELDRADEAEAVLKSALQRAPESQRALLELARLYDRSDRTTEQAIALETLSRLPLSSMLGAEVAYRRASLLLPSNDVDPYSPEAERARAYLLEAVGADSKHVAARQALMELARARLEWSVVAHMHYLAIRELPEGAARAAHHLDLAETYIDHLQDVDSAVRNIESAITQAPDDLVVATRTASITARLPDPRHIADRMERIATSHGDLDGSARARLWLLVSDLRVAHDDLVAAESAARQVLALSDASAELIASARRTLDVLEGDDRNALRKQKSGLLRLLELEQQPTERVHILARLRELGRALEDPELESWASEEQLELAGTLEGNDEDMTAAAAALRDAYAERGAYAEVVALYERVADRSEGPTRARALLESARFAWSALRSAARASAALRSSVEVSATDPDALALLSELVANTNDDPNVTSVYETIRGAPREHRDVAYDLELARVAADLGRAQDAIAILRPLCVQTEDHDIRFAALTQLDAVLAQTASPPDRIAITRRLFEASLERNAPGLADVALDLAECERELGNPERGIAVLEQALRRDPDHVQTLAAYAGLLEDAEEWARLGDTLLRLSSLSSDPAAQADHAMAAAQAFVEQGAVQRGNRPQALARARKALMRAAEATPSLPGPSIRLLPLAFAEGRWDEVLDLGVDVRERAGPDEEVLLLAALTEAYRHGQRSLARDLGFRHGAAAHERYLFPGLRQLLTHIATRGPLPRLDAVLAAASSLAGGRVALSKDLAQWSSGQPLQSGLALGLARLAEAGGHAERARSLYQVTAFMVPDGPVPNLVARLPIAPPPDDATSLLAGSFESAGPLRDALLAARDGLAGVTRAPQHAEDTPSSTAAARVALAQSILHPWRTALKRELPVAWSHARRPGGVGVANHATPTIVLSAGATVCSVAELRFRLARAATTIAFGLAVMENGDGVSLEELLDGIGRLASPSHIPTTRAAHEVADALAARGVSLPTRDAEQLARELAHWTNTPGGFERLQVELRRTILLVSTRLCGQLDGALLTLSHDRGFVSEGRPDPVATLRYEDAYWLLRALQMY